jgi:hypothetical protein
MQILKLTSCVLTIILLQVPTSTAGIRDVGNGGGASEQVLLYAWSRWPELLQPALESSICKSGSGRNTVLEKMIFNHQKERQLGGIFFPNRWTHAPSLVYFTQSFVGAPIEFNVSALYGQRGPQKALGLAEALDLLLSAIAEHDLQSSKEDVARARSCLKNFWAGDISETNFSAIAHPEVSLLAIRSKAQIFGQVLLVGFGEGYKDITSQVKGQLLCDEGIPLEFEMDSLYWDTSNLRAVRQSVILVARGRIHYRCLDSGTQKVTSLTGLVALQFGVQVVSGSSQDFVQSPEKYLVKKDSTNVILELTDLH